MSTYTDYLTKLFRPPLAKRGNEDFLWVDRNEPPFGAFETIEGLITDEDLQNMLRVYPDPYEIYEALAPFYGVDPQQLLLTHGSEQGLRYVFDTYLDFHDEVVYAKPSFGMYEVYAYYKKAQVTHLEYTPNRELPIETILATVTPRTRLLVIANPNSPTGTAYTLEEIEHIAEHTAQTGTIFLLDEAYYHFYSLDTLPLLQRYSHVVISRTFSKAWGLAGLRIGVLISTPDQIQVLRSQKLAMEINQFSILLCRKAIENADSILARNVNQVKKWQRIFKETSLPHLDYLETQTNFILLKSHQYDFHKQRLLDNKILPKMDFPDPCMQDCIRISVYTDEAMEQILTVLEES